MSSAAEYAEFLAGKRRDTESAGFQILEADLSGPLFDWQAELVVWALDLGRACIFADCGLGKTIMQLEWAHQVAMHTGEPVLILTPLAVAQQTLREAQRFGYQAEVTQDGTHSEPIVITNYERLERFDPSEFAGVVLDESSILKSYMGKTKQALLRAFAETDYRLACTATPSPNDHMELGNHAQFLGVMDSNEMLARWFINDTMSAGAYRIKAHARVDFWAWVGSWAVCIGMPSDVAPAHSNNGFVLPPLEYHEHVLEADQTAMSDEDKYGQISLVRDGRLSATKLHRELRLSAPARAQCVADLVNGSDEPWLIWCNTNYESDALRKLIPDAVEVRGSDKEATKESRLNGFSTGEIRVMLTKPSIAGFGMNWQHCSNVAFVGLSYSFEQFYQAVRRTWRFGQTRPVSVHIVRTDTEGDIVRTVRGKMEKHSSMRREMEESVRDSGKEYGLTTGEIQRREGDGWTMVNGDSIQVVGAMESDSVGFSIFSPPFSNLYIYSDREEDLGNSADDGEFFEHFGYLMHELLRVTMPGRLSAIHCKDLPLYMNRDGAAGLRDFPGRTIAAMESNGWTYHSRVTIWKCPVIEMQRTKNHGLLYKNLRANSAQNRQGMADYVLTFRKWAEEGMADNPIEHTHEEFPLDTWQKWASPVWDDIRQTEILRYTHAKTADDERHICPLQLEVIRRCLGLWSNPGDLVLSPFAGIGSEGYEALKWGRRFIGVELKESYYDLACKNLESVEVERTQGSLFA